MIAKALGSIIHEILSNPIVLTAGLLMLGALVVAWLIATVWAFQDASSRSARILVRYLAASWILVSGPMLLPLSVPIYNLVRPAARKADRDLAVVEELFELRSVRSACFACATRIDPAWVRCPACTTWLAALCDRCERWAPRDATICPWCAWEPAVREAEVIPDPPGSPAPTRRPLTLRRLRAGLAAIADLVALR